MGSIINNGCFNEELVTMLERALGADLVALHLLNLTKVVLTGKLTPEHRTMVQQLLDEMLRDLTPPKTEGQGGPYR